MPIFIDQLQRKVNLPHAPQRIVSLVPSQTELLFDLGLGNRIVGITRYCIHPADAVRHVTKVGGTKQFNFAKIDELRPDLIIANKEENYPAGITRLIEKYPVWISDIYQLQDALELIHAIGKITKTSAEAHAISQEIKLRFASLDKDLLRGKTCAYFIWRKPYMVVGCHTFIDAMLHELGVTNVFADRPRYFEINLEELAARHPDFIFLSSEPYAFRAHHTEEILAYVPTAQIQVVDGELFSWYGSRLQHTPAYFSALQRELCRRM